MSERNGRQYQAWSNSLTRVLNQIGFKAVADKPPALQDYLAARSSQAPAAAGRPSTYSQEIADEVCRRLAGGESLRAICRDEGIPNESTVRLWALDDREGFAAQYARAREVQFLAIADELLEIADDGRNDWMQRRGNDERGGCELNGEHIQRSRVRIDTRKWMLSKMLPKVYGDKTEVAVTGANGGPVQSERVTVTVPANDPIEAARVYQKLMSGD